MRSGRGRRGITLIEVLVIITAVIVLAAVLLPALSRSNESARRAQCMSNLKQFGMALNMYAQDFGECFPSTVGYNAKGKPPIKLRSGDGLAGLTLLHTHKYVASGTATSYSGIEIFRCPSDADLEVDPSDKRRGVAGAGCTTANTSYGYDPRHKTTHPAGTAVMADRGDPKNPRALSPNHPHKGPKGEGTNVLYIDGHVSWFARTDVGHGGREVDYYYTGGNEIYDPADDAADPESASHIIR